MRQNQLHGDPIPPWSDCGDAVRSHWREAVVAGFPVLLADLQAQEQNLSDMVERWPYMARGYFGVSNRRAEIARGWRFLPPGMGDRSRTGFVGTAPIRTA